MRNTPNGDPSGTSYHDTTIKTTVTKLRSLVGEPSCEQNDGSDKVNFDWTCETSNGDVFTIYDWKEYRPISEDEVIEFHIGAHNKNVSEMGVKELKNLISE